jgi:hypothetical protein
MYMYGTILVYRSSWFRARDGSDVFVLDIPHGVVLPVEPDQTDQALRSPGRTIS